MKMTRQRYVGSHQSSCAAVVCTDCFFRSLSDQLKNHEHDYDEYRQTVMAYVAEHEEEFAPFMSFGESEEEEVWLAEKATRNTDTRHAHSQARAHRHAHKGSHDSLTHGFA